MRLAPLRCPLYLLVGNHDDRESMRRAFPDHAYLAQGSEFGFGKMYARGINEETLIPGEDRFVRLSAAYGLAQLGKPHGVTGLVQIFDEATADGRGREVAFRTLASLNDERPLSFMRRRMPMRHSVA